MIPFNEVTRLDALLSELARGESRQRLRLGELLDALAAREGHHELGFSSLGAYARERCGRSGRWATESRTLARRLAELPRLRAALAGGALGWCMAELVARQATSENESHLVELALGSTVREMRERLQLEPADLAAPLSADDTPPDTCTVSVTLSAADAWLWQWTRRFAEQALELKTTDAFVNALLQEAVSGLCAAEPANDGSAFAEPEHEDAERTWQKQLAEWRRESERRCEANFSERGPGGDELAPALELPGSLQALDSRIAAVARELSAREVELARVARRFHEAEGWRRLGYSTESQYARERLGISPSSFKAKLALARRWCAPVREALGNGELGYESALLVSRVATSETAEAWLERAQARTVKQLEEEVKVAELSRDMGGNAGPPDEETVRAIHHLEARVLSGDRSGVLEVQSQMSARLGAGGAKVQLNLRLTPETARFWKSLSEQMRKHLSRDTSFVRFLCDAFWETWKHLCERTEAYAHIYARDRYTCSSPVCSRKDVTPHHIVLRSHGGSDDDENVIALCTWCHLEGVHGGNLEVTGTAGSLSWKSPRGGWLGPSVRAEHGGTEAVWAAAAA